MKSRRAERCAILLLVLWAYLWLAGTITAQSDFGTLSPRQEVAGFVAVALYVDDDGRAMGARFVHEATGFTLDYLRMETAPGYFIWVNSWPTSDMGEPHTQEHLLLGKGNKGRQTSSLRSMMLIESSAFTMQWRTCYHAQTAAGPEAFFAGLAAELDALLHPDYTDEEIRREVCNVGVADGGNGMLRLEEKGTVYNEMVSSFERPWSRMSRALDTAIYGSRHPLAYVSGGEPAAIRSMKPEDIRTFHRRNYRLDNMGMIVALPSSMPFESTLSGIRDVLVRTGGNLSHNSGDARAEARAADPVNAMMSPAPTGSIFVADYPQADPQTTGPVLMAWPVAVPLSVEDEMALSLFVDAFAGDASTDLYRRFVDAQTRTIHTGATGVFGWVSRDQGHPLYIGLGNVDPTWMTNERLDRIRSVVMDELRRVSEMPDGSDALAEFNGRVTGRIVAARREARRFLGRPPGFGFRNSGAQWMETLRQLESVDGFRKSPTFAAQYAAIEARMATGNNMWRDLLQNVNIVEREPYVAAARPNPELIARESEERRQRLTQQVHRLMNLYRTSDEQAALRRYKAEYDSVTRRLDSIAARCAMPAFVRTPPMTIDDNLSFTHSVLPNGVPIVQSTFDDMSGATIGVALRLDDVAPESYPILSALPVLLTESGVVVNGDAVTHAVVSERMRRDISGLNVYFDVNADRGRYELVTRVSGLTQAESDTALGWMNAILFHADWRRENLVRLREIVDQEFKGLRNTMQRAEEAWVHDPATAWRREHDHLYLVTSSFLTRLHNLHRLRWMLRSIDGVDDTAALGIVFEKLASSGQGSKRGAVKILLQLLGGAGNADRAPRRLQDIATAATSLSPASRQIITDAALDVEAMLNDIPEEALAADIRYVFEQMRRDLFRNPEEVLKQMEDVRNGILKRGRARFFAIGSSKTLQSLRDRLVAFSSTLSPAPLSAIDRQSSPIISQRLTRRRGEKRAPRFVGLVNPSTSSGVIISSAPAAGYASTDNGQLIDLLAGTVLGGHGAHSIFMKTWGAGLAYSNGIRTSPRSGRVVYYAERCPAIPQTLSYVIDEVRKTAIDSTLVEYAIAQTFAESRAGATYEARGEAMAADIADGVTPDVIRGFRKRILAMRNEPNLAARIRARIEPVCSAVLPGWGASTTSVQGGTYFAIGPDAQLDLFSEFVRHAEGPDAEVVRLYPSDFWICGR